MAISGIPTWNSGPARSAISTVNDSMDSTDESLVALKVTQPMLLTDKVTMSWGLKSSA